MLEHHLELLVCLIDAPGALRVEHLRHQQAERKFLPRQLLSLRPAERPRPAAADEPERVSRAEEDEEALQH